VDANERTLNTIIADVCVHVSFEGGKNAIMSCLFGKAHNHCA
jgi:hypothetical protein